ncbi:hypothetical protein MTY_1277 [Moorella thermoacetica Y72]|uniref:Uncharacterized protein n=1 Tax=Moorella thermoacetica Y72 TaxID=1325331 RepID=A0A0S6UCD0_NEOTH|nr:hypothetical protein MTY_1277 [Moorella thermoacetica Y72]
MVLREPDWWRKIKSGEYRGYYRRMYAARLGKARG